ncbi:uncharacterized protein LOC128341517 [Hemicordylus capensis]|uniref:uncharacterized protein LOC128341517 n=1 Tax=Hemicordylus capensis TaxID=884348 RepID=UPI0023038303|nr:uncharacterized protein LOC128341517 [Hemicordylus capensis]XP_053143697.1 uncharacterized protein LOC128341517 [Hemicordylus capensis]XP_053143698.1 uncharacterized protein LOC128341517 [Hemicordylus capensis]XP_053143699.1 uncharacterized protein LOC128341517 [Hemicordylus capensis]XP_053143700.1 uncharacterized protein LOC128341517 [Hemicordylus capensis]XP_053143701.1 uncharacterized protein LOC128341517 [Hemicordylus capensis]XP_053143702.1 uncharacterized protein LOC128341517 [Hemico
MDTTDKTTGNQVTIGQMTKETQYELIPVFNPEGSSDEDALSGLRPEEKECLEFLLQTIENLDGDLLEADEEGSPEKTAGSLGAEDQCNISVGSSTQQSGFAEAATAKPGPGPMVSKVKMTLSEESGSQCRPDSFCPKAKGPARLGDSHPAHFRKFDTIMRSGVNVQELRSRFLLHLESPAAVKGPMEAAAAAFREPTLLPAGQKSPRDEALQKLGLLQRNASFPNTSRHLMPMATQQGWNLPVEGLECEAVPSSISNPGEFVHAHTTVTVQKQGLPQ